MFAEERHQIILEKVIKNKTVSVKELAKLFEVSMPTIRSDLDELCLSNSNIERTHGGIMWISESPNLTNYDERKILNLEEKIEIASLAITFIEQKDTILIDSSSTCYELADLLVETDKKITVITTGLNIAIKLKENANLTVVIIGGTLKAKSNTVQDSFDDNIINAFNIDKFFFSASGISIENGFSDYNYNEVTDKRKFLSKCRKSFALIDSSKFNIDSKSSFAQLSEVNNLITNRSVDPKIIKKYKKNINILTS